MILPIRAYGDPVLKKVAEEIDQDHEGLQELIDNMFETMYNANGVGLAAPQIGLSIRLFLVDTISALEEDEEDEFEGEEGIKEAFINPEILEKDGDEWAFAEGCLSIPNIREDVYREESVRIKYYDRDFQQHEKTFYGFASRVIQHEYDHIEGILFTEYLKPLKRTLLRGRLNKISKGDVKVDYRMRFYQRRK